MNSVDDIRAIIAFFLTKCTKTCFSTILKKIVLFPGIQILIFLPKRTNKTFMVNKCLQTSSDKLNCIFGYIFWFFFTLTVQHKLLSIFRHFCYYLRKQKENRSKLWVAVLKCFEKEKNNGCH